MIFFISDGRLGNEIFQYAFLKSIAKENEKIISLNMNNLKNVFEVHNPQFKTPKLSKYMLFLITKLGISILEFLLTLKVIKGYRQNKKNGRFSEGYSFRDGFLPFSYVESGFFQSEQFFEPSMLDLSIKKYILEKSKDILSDLGNYNFVFVHVRRGDYLGEIFNGVRGINLPRSYFLKSIEEVSRDVSNPFYIFLSDDPDFIEIAFDMLENKYVSKNDMAVDLALMSLCQYGVCSNSSFSWWGAFLMKERKKVAFPRYWYGWKVKIESHPGIQPSWGHIVDSWEVRKGIT